MAASADVVPSARSYPFISSAGDLTYLWGGLGDTEPEAVFIYYHDTETWTRKHTSGPHPPTGLNEGGSAMSGHNLYLYGGHDKNESNLGDLYELNTQTWQWRKVSDGSAGGPGKKYECKMISHQDQLLVVGGIYYEMPSSRQAGARYGKFGNYVQTNEVHGYSLTSGSWISPPRKGSRPPPCSNFSLTRTDEDRAVMFGGVTALGSTSKAWALHLPTMTWSQHKEGYPWPWIRVGHIAACLGYGGQHQTLLISGGHDDDFNTHDDMWLLDPQSGRMEEVHVPGKYKKLIQRSGHGAAAVTLNSDCVEVILFGGLIVIGGSIISDPVVLRFECQKKFPKRGNWSLTDIADSTQLGSPARLAAKRGMICVARRRLEQQLQECRVREEELQRKVKELQAQVDDANGRADASHRRADAASPNLNEQDLDRVFSEVFPAKAKWKVIGLKLGIHIGNLKAIEGSNAEEKLIETLTIWLRSGINTTWKALAEAMGADTVGHNDIKECILAKH